MPTSRTINAGESRPARRIRLVVDGSALNAGKLRGVSTVTPRLSATNINDQVSSIKVASVRGRAGGGPAEVLHPDAHRPFERMGIGEEHLEVGPGRSRSQRPLAEGALLPVHQVLGREIVILEDGPLVHVDLFPARPGTEPAVFHHVEKERGARIGRGDVEEGEVEGEALREVDRLANRLD